MKKIILLAVWVCSCLAASASHLRCGYISVERVSQTTNQVKVTLTIFTNSDSDVLAGGDGMIDFGDGTTHYVPDLGPRDRPDLGDNVAISEWTEFHTYASMDFYTISYVEPNRNGGVINMDNSYYTTFYTETSIDLSKNATHTPVILAPPVFSGSTTGVFSASLGAASHTDDLLTYSLATPYKDRGAPVTGYKQPESLTINPLTGMVTWDMLFNGAFRSGEYNFVVVVRQKRKTGNDYETFGFVRIEFQVILLDEVDQTTLFDNQSLDSYSRLLVEPGTTKKIKMFMPATKGGAELTVFSELSEDVISFTTYDSISSTNGSKLKVGILTLTPTEEISREHGYLIVIRGRVLGRQFSIEKLSSDISYLMYTQEIPEFSVITKAEDELAEVNVFPNPIEQYLKIELNKPGYGVVTLYNTQGLALKEESFQSETELSIDELPAGVYICEIRSNNLLIKKIKLFKK